MFGKRWTEDYKKKIIESRETAAHNIAIALDKIEMKPKAFICASAVGYYGNSGENILTEKSPPGKSFTSEVCRRWENAAAEVEKYNIRRVSLRTATVFNEGEGALEKLALPFKFFVGGTLGNGNQWFPWIHIKDLVRIYLFALDNDRVNGEINAVSPDLVRLKEITDGIGNVLHRPSLFKVPGFVLKIALGEFADELLASIKASPEKLRQYNFNFEFGKLGKALEDLLKKQHRKNPMLHNN